MAKRREINIVSTSKILLMVEIHFTGILDVFSIFKKDCKI